jgi:hypothetical protein
VNLPVAARDDPTKAASGRAMLGLPEMMGVEPAMLFP